MDERVIALVGEGGGAGAVIVAAEGDGTTMFGGALVGGVFE
jgi:hypothetical protein